MRVLGKRVNDGWKRWMRGRGIVDEDLGHEPSQWMSVEHQNFQNPEREMQ